MSKSMELNWKQKPCSCRAKDEDVSKQWVVGWWGGGVCWQGMDALSCSICPPPKAPSCHSNTHAVHLHPQTPPLHGDTHTNTSGWDGREALRGAVQQDEEMRIDWIDLHEKKDKRTHCCLE